MNRGTLALGLLLALVVAGVSAEDRVPPIVTGLRVEGDAVQTYRCTLGADVTGNAANLNDALADRTKLYPLSFPAGRLDITEPIVIPPRTGFTLQGVGSSKDLDDIQYADGTNHLGGAVSRIVWRGNSTGDMLTDNGLGDTIQGIHFQGAPSPIGGSDHKALVGIHVNTFAGSGNGVLNSGKVAIRDCSFHNVQTGILFGRDMTPAGGDGHYTGDDDSNADESYLSNLRFFYPYADGNPIGEQRNCMLFRSNQSLGFTVEHIRVNGCPGAMFYFERGGRFVCTSSELSGANDTNPSVVLRLKTVDGEANYQVHCDIDGSTGVTRDSEGNITSYGIGGNFRLLQMDGGLNGAGDAGDSYIELSGTIAPTDYATPIVIAHGACNVVLRGVHGLLPHSVRMIGHIVSTAEHRTCNVHLDGCSLLNCSHVADLIESGSSGPIRLTWTNCQKMAFGGNYAQPFADGAVDGGDPVDGGGNIPGSTPDLIP